MNQTIQDHKPPRLPQRFLRWYCKPELLEDIEGDIHEDFNKRYTRSGKRHASLFYLLDVIRFFRPFVIKKLFKTQNTNTMFKLNTIIAFRHLAKNKLYSFINITGLAIGIAACLIIAHYVIFQLSYDSFHENNDRLYRVHIKTLQNQETVEISPHSAFAMGPAMIQDVPEIALQTRVHPFYGDGIVSEVVDSVSTGSFREQDIFFVDPSFLDMFSFEFTQGNAANALKEINSVVITESTREKYFADSRNAVIGKILRVSGGWANGDFQVSGVVKDPPANSHFQFDFLIPIATALQDEQYQSDGADWGWSNFYTYVLLTPNTTEEAAEAKIAPLMRKYQGERLNSAGYDQELTLQNLPDIHLRSEVSGSDDMSQPGDIKSVYFMIVIAVFILVIAWINFINLSTAKASERGLEVGIKKALGAHKKQLIFQFLTESFWVNFIAIAFAILLTYAFVPYLSAAIDQTLEVNLLQPVIFSFLILLVLAGPVIAGIYPSLILSSFRTVIALKGKFVSRKSHAFSLRKGLVVFQFVISTLLIAGTFAVSEQLSFMQDENTGMNLGQTLAVKGPELNVTRVGFEAFKNNVSKIAGIESISSSRSVPGAGYNWGTEARRSGEPESNSHHINVTWVDEVFTQTMGIELVSGRDFSEATREGENGMLINEATLEEYGLGTAEEALTQRLIISGDTIPIRGVLKNHHWNSLHSNYSSAIFLYRWASLDYFTMKVTSNDIRGTIKQVEAEFQEAFPENPVEYYFLDDFFNRQYKADLAFANIFRAFSAFAIFAACLGLFGLASYSVVQKAKEIGIRRVLGASGIEITVLFSKRYLALMLIANVIAVPIAYYGIQDWLSNFAFSIGITAELFLIPMVLLLIIAAITISFQTIKAAMANPVKNLRSE